MIKHRLLLSLAAAAAIALTGAGAASAASAAPGASVASGASTATTASTASGSVGAAAATPLDQCSAAYFDGDANLGPAQLPALGPVGFQLLGYRRTGGEAPARFLARYRNGEGWIYPPDNGYVIGPDGRPIEWVQTLIPGQHIDRYGSVYGGFLAPEGTLYAARSIPPSSLDSTPAAPCNYHDYLVLRPLPVDAGPIAPWFAQPGGGEQYQLDATLVPGAPAQLNVLWLLSNGYLRELPDPAV